jgi:hypothetical protein
VIHNEKARLVNEQEEEEVQHMNTNQASPHQHRVTGLEGKMQDEIEDKGARPKRRLPPMPPPWLGSLVSAH